MNVSTQVFVPSKDGTRIPMFIVARKNVTLDGNNPTFLYAYGGVWPQKSCRDLMHVTSLPVDIM